MNEEIENNKKEIELKLYFSNIEAIIAFIKAIDIKNLISSLENDRNNLLNDISKKNLEQYIKNSTYLYEINSNIINILSDFVNITK